MKIKKILVGVFMGTICILVQGCGDPIQWFMTLQLLPQEQRKSSFYVEIYRSYARQWHVSGIKVFRKDQNSGEENICWNVIATESVAITGFNFIAGEMPEGFVQHTPKSNQKYEPVRDEMYRIQLFVKEKPDVIVADICWIP